MGIGLQVCCHLNDKGYKMNWHILDNIKKPGRIGNGHKELWVNQNTLIVHSY